jgi:hypothetical protein
LEDLDLLDRDWPSHLACELWARVTSPHGSACLDFGVQYGANDGIEVRIPYADVRLTECILRIPADQRLGDGGPWALRQSALGRSMPREFDQRPPQAPWTPVFAHAARCAFPRIADLVGGETWLSAPYVNRDEVKRRLTRLTQDGTKAPERDFTYLAEFGALEAWLRLLLRYDADREVVDERPGR